MAWARRQSAGWLPPALSSKARSPTAPNEAIVIRETIVLAALAISSPAVVDGDTVRIAGASIRLTDYDSPELYSPKCPREQAASNRISSRRCSASITAAICSYDLSSAGHESYTGEP